MSKEQISNLNHKMSLESIRDFITYEIKHGADANMVRRYKRSVESVYVFLPEDKTLTKERLLLWRESMEQQDYSSVTIQNYVKYVNRYLRYIDCSEMQFQRGRAKDITNMTFGYLTALEVIGKDQRKNNIWLCQCKCGNTIEVPATQLLSGNNLSCGCLYGEHLSRVNKNIDNTNLRQVLKDEVSNKSNKSGYIGVTPKGDKWKAYINYKGKRYWLGTYKDVDDAVRARLRAKELIMEDASELLQYYEDIHKDDLALPNKDSIQRMVSTIKRDINRKY